MPELFMNNINVWDPMSVGLPKSTNCAPLLADLILHSLGANKCVRSKMYFVDI
jgi:hypothetical protein